MNAFYTFCQNFLKDDDSETPVALVCQHLQENEELTAIQLAAYLDTFISPKYPLSSAYRDFLRGYGGFDPTFVSKLSQLAPHPDPAQRRQNFETLSEVLRRGGLDFETMVTIAVLFFVIPGASPGQILSLVEPMEIRHRKEDPGKVPTAPADLLSFVRLQKHLPPHYTGPDSSLYPFEITQKDPCVIGRRFFESIRSPRDFAIDPEPFSGGTFGRVFRAGPRSNSAVKNLAVKKMARPRGGGTFKDPVYTESAMTGAFFREVLCLLFCAHETVLPVIGWNLIPDETQQFMHITALMSRQIVVGEPENPRLERLSETVRLKIAYGIARGMSHLHRLGVLHRDLKLDNVFCDGEGDPRIADLGWSKAARIGERHSGRRGTLFYAAPEVLNRSGLCDLSADVYSYGICLWELIKGRLWGPSITATGIEIENRIVNHGLRPDLTGMAPDVQELLRHCFGPEIEPAKRYSFAQIIGEIEGKTEAFFPRADLAAFREYKGRLDRAGEPEMDENLIYLLRQLTNMVELDNRLQALELGSPFVDKVIFCLGRLFGDEAKQDENVSLVARYQFATKRCLDGPAFLQELAAFGSFPAGRSHFPLADFLIAPGADVGPDRVLSATIVPNRDSLVRALRNIVAGICCEHPCVLKVHGWNIVKNGENWEILMVTDRAEPFSIADLVDWDDDRQAAFLLTVAIGMLEVHCRGVFHNCLKDAGSLRIRNGRAQICNFGLMHEKSSYMTDTVDAQELFRHARGEFSRLRRIIEFGEEHALYEQETTFQGYIPDLLKHEDEVANGPDRPLRNLSEQIRSEVTGCSFPFDLYFHLLRSKEFWKSNDEPLDVAEILVQLTRGLDQAGKDRFKVAVNQKIAADHFLSSDFLSGY
jgi:serine/threonine protein kinase